MTRTSTRHDTTVVPAGNGHRALCTCGWDGGRRVYSKDARRQAAEHIDRAARQTA